MVNLQIAHGECFAKQNVSTCLSQLAEPEGADKRSGNHRPCKFLFGLSFVTNCLRQFTQDERGNKKTALLLLAILIPNIVYCYGTKPQWQFSSKFLTTYHHQESQPHGQQHATSSNSEKPSDASSFPSQTTIEKAINIAAFAYACMRIYNRYQAMHATASLDDSWTGSLKNALSAFCPALIQSIGAHGLFFIDSTGIVFETLVYKAIAKLMVLCAYGDIGDFIKGAASVTSSIARGLIL